MYHELREGWGWPGNARKAHFFAEGQTRCLCGKWGFYFGPRGNTRHDSPDNCAECNRLRRSRIEHKREEV